MPTSTPSVIVLSQAQESVCVEQAPQGLPQQKPFVRVLSQQRNPNQKEKQNDETQLKNTNGPGPRL